MLSLLSFEAAPGCLRQVRTCARHTGVVWTNGSVAGGCAACLLQEIAAVGRCLPRTGRPPAGRPSRGSGHPERLCCHSTGRWLLQLTRSMANAAEPGGTCSSSAGRRSRTTGRNVSHARVIVTPERRSSRSKIDSRSRPFHASCGNTRAHAGCPGSACRTA